MNTRLAPRFAAFAFAALTTLALAAGIDGLADAQHADARLAVAAAAPKA